MSILKPTLLTIALLTTASFIQAEPAVESDKPAEPTESSVLVTVNGQPITKQLLNLYLQQRAAVSRGQKQDPGVQQSQALGELLTIEMISQQPAAKELEQQADVALLLDLQRKQALSQLVLQQELIDRALTEEQLKERYAAQDNQPTTEYKARHILVKTEDEAKKLIEELDQGADFAELATTHSQGPSGKNGGDLGWFSANRMVQPFSEAVAVMEPKSHSKAPVKTRFGWHVILLEEVREVPPPSFEQVKAKLQQQARQDILKDYMAEVRKQANIQFVEADVALEEPTTDAK